MEIVGNKLPGEMVNKEMEFKEAETRSDLKKIKEEKEHN